MKSKQTGVTLIGFLIVLVVLGFFAFMAMKLVPSYIEYMGVEKAMLQISTEGANGKTLDDMRRELAFKMNFQYVDDSTIQPSDVTLTRTNGAGTLNVQYDKQVPFFANIDFLLHFNHSVALQGTVGG